MNTPSAGTKIINIIAVISGFTGMLMAVKIPGTVSLLPLVIGLLLGLTTLFITRKKQQRCVGCYLATSLALIGIIISVLVQLTTEPEVAVDKKFEKQTEKTATEVEQDLDDALNELDFE